MQEIRRKYFGERKKGHSPRPGNIRPANRPPIGRPIRPLTTNRPDFRPRFPDSPIPRFPDSLFPCFPVRFPGSGPDLVLEKIPEPQTVRPIDNPADSPADSPADRPSHKQTAPQTNRPADSSRRAPPSRHKKKTPAQFPVRASGYRIRRGHPPVLFSAEITLRPLSWRQPSWPTWPRQPPWRSSERPVRRCRRASSSRPKR